MKPVNNAYFSLSLQVNAAELASLVESAAPVVNRLALIAATSEFGEDPEGLRSLRDWVDHAFAALVELCELAAERVDVELEAPLAPPAAPTPNSIR